MTKFELGPVDLLMALVHCIDNKSVFGVYKYKYYTVQKIAGHGNSRVPLPASGLPYQQTLI